MHIQFNLMKKYLGYGEMAQNKARGTVCINAGKGKFRLLSLRLADVCPMLMDMFDQQPSRDSSLISSQFRTKMAWPVQ